MTAPYELESALDGFVVTRGEDVAARLVVAPTGLSVRENATHQEHLLPWSGAKLERRPDGALLVRSKRGVAGSADPGFLRAIEGAVGNEFGAQIARLEGKQSRLAASGWFGCALFFAALVLLVWSVPGCIRRGVNSAVDSAPFTVDEALGEAAQGAMEVGPLVEDERVVGALDAIVDRLGRAADDLQGRPEVTWQVRVVRDPMINAFALPGGYVTVFTGLIEAAETPEMVAGVLAHEMAHVTERHGLKRIGQSLGLFAAIQLLLGDASGLGGIAKEVLTVASVNAYSREQETEADLVGAHILHDAEVDPRALGEFFGLLRERGKEAEVPIWMSTHPAHLERIAAIAAEAERLGVVEWRPLEVDWAAVQAALAR